MISFLKGALAGKSESGVIIDVGGVGYSVSMPASDIAKIGDIGEKVTVYTHFHMSENAIGLFGFLTNEQIDYFNKLISISGIGPKAAISVLGTLSVQDLAFAIIAEDVKAITRAPGVGPKAAQRIILELKGKIDTQDAVAVPDKASVVAASAVRADTGAVNALIALGASPSEAQKTVMQIDATSLTTEEVIKEALRRMSNGI
ncbi:MAG: Holliday junction branch migration protein RuvA [Clostridia bacterium]|nr:Holliday junction branch migration protein RuvA [Clostridia bacterium]